MASALKDQFGPAVPREIARQISAVWKSFDARAFLRDALSGYEPLSLTLRARHIAGALRTHLPADYVRAVALLVESTAQPHAHRAAQGMSGFLFLPHTLFVATHGLDHFEASMAAQHALTQRFTAEFSIRPFIERHPERTLARLAQWTGDPSEHVRRLVSEGTRPRLPWASRLPAFQRDPAPVISLLEHLRDDGSLYVRRSVANNLNDIGKDNPQVLEQVARRWLRGAGAERQWIVRHALRSAIKRAEPGALTLLGYGGKAAVRVVSASVTPGRARIGGSVTIACELTGTAHDAAPLMVDLVVHYMKASGERSPKVFKWKTLALARGDRVALRRRLSLQQLTTRRHHPGRHEVSLQINGQSFPLGVFDLLPA